MGFVAFWGRDTHYANIPYNLWKVHLASYDKALPYRYIYVDSLFRNYLKGKSREEIETWFPSLQRITQAEIKEGSRKVTDEEYFQRQHPGCQVYWGEWTNAFVFQDNRLVDMMVCKG
ncbi:MAG: hypothetical protein QM758_30050 [Armatimonas sp.]